MSTAIDGLRLALHVTTRVQAGNKVEITAPELKGGQDVGIFLIPGPSRGCRADPRSSYWTNCPRVRGRRRLGTRSSGDSRRNGTHGIASAPAFRSCVRRY
jgi:hypothetical protein